MRENQAARHVPRTCRFCGQRQNLKAVGDVAQNAKGMGEKAVEVAVQVIKDKNAAASIPKVIDSGLTLVHPWNVDAYSKANFGQ